MHTYAVRSGVSVHWRNPKASTFNHVVVRYARGYTAPTRSTLGRGVRPARRRSQSVRLPRLTPNTVYTVAIWTVGAHRRRSAPARRTFTSDALRGPRGQYVGQVVDDQGHPLLHAEVVATSYTGDGSLSHHTATDVHGRFRLRLVAGSWRVGIGGPRITGGDSDAAGYLGSDVQVVVHAGATLHAGVVALTPGGAVSGRVVDATGHALAGVQADVIPVRAHTDNATSMQGDFGFAFDDLRAVFTGSDGRYTIKGVPLSTAMRVCMTTGARPVVGGAAGSSGYVDQCLPTGVVSSRGAVATEPDLTLDTAAGGTVSGTVAAPSGTGLGGAYVTLNPSSGLPGGYAVTNPDGSFEARGVAPGQYQVCADPVQQAGSHRTGNLSGCRRAMITVRPGDRTAVSLTLAVGAAITGKVTGPDGRPLADIDVDVEGYGFEDGGLTDASGHYAVTGLPTGRISVCFIGQDSRTHGLKTGPTTVCFRNDALFGVRAGSELNGVDGRLGAAAAISGTVRDSAGKPVAFAEVDAIPLDTEGDDDGGSVETNAAGHYLVPGLEQSKYQVCFGRPNDDFKSASSCYRGHVPTALARTTEGIDGVLPTVAAISVTVHDTAGHPVAGVEVLPLAPCVKHGGCASLPLFRSHPGTNVFSGAITNGAGRALLTNLQPGDYAVCLYGFYAATASGTPIDGYADRCSGSTFTIVARAGRSTAVRETLSDGGAISGTVTDGSGHPLAGVVVGVSSSAAADYESVDLSGGYDGNPLGDSPTSYSVTGADGSYTVRSVRPGTSTVCATTDTASGPDPAGYFSQCLGGKVGSTKGGTAVTVTVDQNRGGTDLALAPAAGISGTVTEPGGKELNSVDVEVYAGRSRRMVADERTNSDGTYTINQLPTGSYSVCADDYDLEKGQCYRNVAWKNDQDYPPLTATTLVTAGAGAFTGGIDFRVTP